MYLLVIILNEELHFDLVVSILIEANVSEASIMDSYSLSTFLEHQLPFFGGVEYFDRQKETASKTLIALIKEKQTLNKVKNLLKREDIDFSKPGIGSLITVPVSEAISSKKQKGKYHE